jgi:hypothetical protein
MNVIHLRGNFLPMQAVRFVLVRVAGLMGDVASNGESRTVRSGWPGAKAGHFNHEKRRRKLTAADHLAACCRVLSCSGTDSR